MKFASLLQFPYRLDTIPGMKRLRKLYHTHEINKIQGTGNPEITGITYDSRRVLPGFVFVALTGLHTDGHSFIEEAIRKGAVAVVYSSEKAISETAFRHPDIVFLQTPNPRIIQSAMAAWLYDNPSEKICVIGVTGTDGKSSTVSYIHQLFNILGKKTGMLSTVEYGTGAEIHPNPYRQSTPEAPLIHHILSEMVTAGCTHAVVEATSHGLSEKTARLHDVTFQGAVFTNISHEHLEFHGSFEQYAFDKSSLFRRLKTLSDSPPAPAIINADDKKAGYFAEAAAGRVITYGIEAEADIKAYGIQLTPGGARFTVRYLSQKYGKQVFDTEITLPGKINIYNCLAALAITVEILDIPPKTAAEKLLHLKGVKGRMEIISAGQPFELIVDYAHTPGAFSVLFPQIRESAKGRIIAVFGSAGERDTEKRYIQGKTAGTYADIIILTDEDPRGENSMHILHEIASGIGSSHTEGENLFLIPDREKAIQKAVETAKPKDMVLLLGKGHEKSIITGGKSLPWDEAEIARKAVFRLYGSMPYL